MLTADTLRLLADAAESHADDPRGDTAEDRRRVQALRIAASDARQVADAGSGYGTPETLALAIVIDNDREMAAKRAAKVQDALDTIYRDDAGNAESEQDALRISHLADALAELVEGWAGFEGWKVGRDADTTHYLPDVAAALARAAFRNVDWIGLARHYVSEARLNA